MRALADALDATRRYIIAPDTAAPPAMTAPRLSPYLSGGRCFACETPHDPRTLLGVCTKCGMPLRVDYDLASIRLKRADVAGRVPSLWRYREVLPLLEGDETSLTEGFTPLLEV